MVFSKAKQQQKIKPANAQIVALIAHNCDKDVKMLIMCKGYMSAKSIWYAIFFF